MRTIHKFPLAITDRQTIDLPGHAEILRVGVQGGAIYLWAVVATNTMLVESRTFDVVGTGNPVPGDATEDNYLGTVEDGPFVWHVFETTVRFDSHD